MEKKHVYDKRKWKLFFMRHGYIYKTTDLAKTSSILMTLGKFSFVSKVRICKQPEHEKHD